MVAPREPFGLVRVSTERIVLEASLLSKHNATWAKVWPDLVGLIKYGNKLIGKEYGWLIDYLAKQERSDLTPKDVQTIQVSRAEVARYLNSTDEAAGRALCQLQAIGVLDLVHKGIPGHSSLYAVMPLF